MAEPRHEGGTLYVVATPIGNLGDMSPRAIETLRQVALIACEDTRRTGVLLRHFGIATATVAVHEHNEQALESRLIEQLSRGVSIALVSDAGTPLISDPGYRLVQAAHRSQIPVRVVPGPCALIAALSGAGIPSDRFVFEGFLPAKAGPRRRRLEDVALETRTLIFYEAPHRVRETVADMTAVFGPAREAVISRELTKQFETIYTGPLSDLALQIQTDRHADVGEIVILVAGCSEEQVAEGRFEQACKALDQLLTVLPTAQAVALTHELTSVPKNILYRHALKSRPTPPVAD